MRNETVLRAAVFDEKLKFYWWVHGIILCVVTVVGWIVLPFWLLGFGQRVCRLGFERLQCDLTDRGLHVRKGYIFRVEKNIPLDKIQDLTVNEGPLLRYLGLASLKIETAGAAAPQGQADASLAGIVDALEFRDAVLDARDRVVGFGSAAPRPAPTDATLDANGEVLVSIRDSLQRIEGLLAKRDAK